MNDVSPIMTYLLPQPKTTYVQHFNIESVSRSAAARLDIGNTITPRSMAALLQSFTEKYRERHRR